MISTFFLSIFFGLVGLLVGFLPTGTLPVALGNAFSYFIGILNAFSYIVPVSTLLQAAAVIVVFDGALLIWAFINWTIRKIPGMQ